jgi:hypothetical protein
MLRCMVVECSIAVCKLQVCIIGREGLVGFANVLEGVDRCYYAMAGTQDAR